MKSLIFYSFLPSTQNLFSCLLYKCLLKLPHCLLWPHTQHIKDKRMKINSKQNIWFLAEISRDFLEVMECHCWKMHSIILHQKKGAWSFSAWLGYFESNTCLNYFGYWLAYLWIMIALKSEELELVDHSVPDEIKTSFTNRPAGSITGTTMFLAWYLGHQLIDLYLLISVYKFWSVTFSGLERH